MRIIRCILTFTFHNVPIKTNLQKNPHFIPIPSLYFVDPFIQVKHMPSETSVNAPQPASKLTCQPTAF